MKVLRAAFLYFALVFWAGFALGTLRTLWLAPWLGDLTAVVIELPLMLLFSWWACGLVLHPQAVSRAKDARLVMGMLALALLLVAEATLSLTLGGLTLAQHLALYATPPVLLGLAGQVLFAIFPLLRDGQQMS